MIGTFVSISTSYTTNKAVHAALELVIMLTNWSVIFKKIKLSHLKAMKRSYELHYNEIRITNQKLIKILFEISDIIDDTFQKPIKYSSIDPVLPICIRKEKYACIL